MPKKTLTVRVVLSVQVDPERYAEAYGIVGAAEIRQDVKDAVLSVVSSGGVFSSDEGIVVNVKASI